MKKSFKAGLCAGLLALPLFAGVGNVFAEGVSSSTDVKLGELQDIIYDVDILWDDMTFDWVFYESIGEYTFKPRTSCKAYSKNVDIAGLAADQDRLYSDASCTTLVVGFASGDPSIVIPDTVYVKDVSGSIVVRDNSRAGRLKAEVSFTPSTNYSWADGDFYARCPYINYGYCMDPGMGSLGISELEPFDALYFGTLNLHAGSTPNHELVPGDTIGTVTIEITQASYYPAP
ncbi:MAG: hypothetical protein K6G36_00390 [Candidatus Saccharibacteria bacterium]|nr:hypothetical protein [Candidatus Saccharibacteria bacterium]